MEEMTTKPERWLLIRQALVFQCKLGLDALRDILMSPVSIMLVVTDVVMANDKQQSYFLRLMKLGTQSDHWINLFGSSLNKDENSNNEGSKDNNVDYWFTKIEELIKEQQEDGKLSQSGREKLQQYLKKVSHSLNRTEAKDADKNQPEEIHE